MVQDHRQEPNFMIYMHRSSSHSSHMTTRAFCFGLLLLVALLHFAESSLVCYTLNGNFPTSFLDIGSSTYSLSTTAFEGDKVFERKPTRNDIYRSPFLRQGVGSKSTLRPRVNLYSTTLPTLNILRGEARDIAWPEDGECEIIVYEPVFAIAKTTSFFTLDANTQSTRVLIPQEYPYDTVQYQCKDSALGYKPGLIYAADAPTSTFLNTQSGIEDVLNLMVGFELGAAFANALTLRVEHGYMGPGGAGLVQHVGSRSAWAKGTKIDLSFVLGTAAPTLDSTVRAAIFMTDRELENSDWESIVCGSTGDDAQIRYDLCRNHDDPSTFQNNAVLDGFVHTMYTGDCCSLVLPRALVAVAEQVTFDVDGQTLISHVSQIAVNPTKPGLWEYPSIVNTRRVCVPGANPDEQVFPCQWPFSDGPSPFPGPQSYSGPFFFDRVLVPARGLVLVCVSADLHFAHAAGLQTENKIPSNQHMFAVDTYVFHQRDSQGCAEACPAGEHYTQQQGILSWTPALPPQQASDHLWLYVIFMSGHTEACLSHACNNTLVYQNLDTYLATSRTHENFTLFSDTYVNVVAPTDFDNRISRRLLALEHAPRKSPTHSAHRRRVLRQNEVSIVAPAHRQRRHVLEWTPENSNAGTVYVRETMGLNVEEALAQASCHAHPDKQCHLVSMDVEFPDIASYCKSEAENINHYQTTLDSMLQGSKTHIISFTRTGDPSLCRQHNSRALLNENSHIGTAKFIVTSDGRLEHIWLRQDQLDAAGVKNLQVCFVVNARSVFAGVALLATHDILPNFMHTGGELGSA